MKTFNQKSDLIVFSLSPFNSSFERTEQIMSRYAKYRRVYFFEAPILGISENPKYLIRETRDDVKVVESYLSSNLSVFEQKAALIELLKDLIRDEKIMEYSVWTDTPKAMPLIRSLKPVALMYDCLQDYSETNPELEAEMFKMADVVFTSGSALYAAKKSLHHNIYHQPDSIDYRHFYQARVPHEEPEDLKNIPHPRIGFAGNLDSSIDFELIKHLAEMKPEWSFVLAGSVVGVDAEALPKLPNIHYLSQKSYVKLPLYLAGFDCTLLPYVTTEATKYVNPSLINQSLVSGCPVVSTSLHDVLHCLGGHELITIADFPINVVMEIENSLLKTSLDSTWIESVDKNFRGMSWDLSCSRLAELEHDVYEVKKVKTLIPEFKEIQKMTGSLMIRFSSVAGFGPREAFYKK